MSDYQKLFEEAFNRGQFAHQQLEELEAHIRASVRVALADGIDSRCIARRVIAALPELVDRRQAQVLVMETFDGARRDSDRSIR